MSWGLSVLVGVITAAVGAVVAGFVATLAVGWYRISGFEAGSAAFVVSFAILGILVGFIIGVIASRTIGSGVSPSFLRALGVSHAALFAIAAIVGVSARLLADVPPTIDAETLMLAVEVRWPEGHAMSPASLAAEPFLRLGSVTASHTLRASSRGPLWYEDAHLVDGRWVAPGAVDIFTTRGRLVLDIVLDSATTHGFLIPLSGRPGRDDFVWTEWYPQARPGDPPLPNGFTYRYRVQKRSEPVRAQVFGPFEVRTIASGFFDQMLDGSTVLATNGEFAIMHRGQPVSVDAMASDPTGSDSTSADSTSTGARLERADAVSLIGGSQPALLAHFTGDNGQSGACYLMTDEAGRLRSLYGPSCGDAVGSILTSDTVAFGKGRPVPRGRINRVAFETPGLYSSGGSVLDTRRLAVHPYTFPEDFSIFPAVAPLGISPDERSFVRFGSHYDGGNRTSIAVVDFVGRRSYLLPIDEARMRYATLDAIDPAWLMHHFEWQKGSDGVDALVERKEFVPIPYHGRYAMADSWWLEPAREGLRDAVIDWLVTEFKGERVPVDSFAYERPVRIGDQTINVAYGGSGQYVSVSLPSGVTDRALLEKITQRLDAALATGKYDSLFGK
jgi:hypothetical protein